MKGRPRQAWFGAIVLAGTGLLGLTVLTGAKSPPAGNGGTDVRPTAGAGPQAKAQPAPDLVIHEWGTFLGMSASDGTALDGMYHEEHALPPFVHSREKDQLRLPFMLLKGETPVIYFYTERPQSVRLGVGFPSGIWTHWYPQAAVVQPTLMDRATSPERLRNGRICWMADIIPASQVGLPGKDGKLEFPAPPDTSSDALWNYSREVDAAYVKTMDATQDPPRPEYDRFLFYRGLGEARLPLRMSARDGGTVSLDDDPTVKDGVRHAFVLRVEKGRAAYRYVPELAPGQSLSGVIPGRDESLPLAEFTRRIGDDLAARLVESGLFAKEARAMVNTWTNSYFQADGIRVLFVLPQKWTDAFIPMAVVPTPKSLVRVMVGRLELLSPERERLAEDAVRGLADPDETRRAQAFATLRAQGRYVEPIVRRVLQTSRDPQVLSLAKRLLSADEVTTLRAAVHDAASGKMLNEDPLMLRALLARLLREIGQEREARAEAVSIMKVLEKTPGRHASYDQPELRAAALEASGLDRSAADVYEQCILTRIRPAGQELSPAWMNWCREWWVARAYARCHARAGDLEATALMLEARLLIPTGGPADPNVRLTRILLAVVREAQGKQDEADVLWSALLRGTTTIASRDGC